MIQRINAYTSSPTGAVRPATGAEKTVGASAAAQATDNSVRQAETGLAALIAEGAPIDEGRVAAIRDALAGGSYVIDVNKLAAKMIELDLGGARP